ncbi:MAG TPA: transglycosylase SLT domain-containing protein [Bacteroidia bacterium]|jgi:membrane-bound lytic murein transglycosylase D|nr:transglycosylase SLT domain-containing protein [Bacteroidia bacterium]
MKLSLFNKIPAGVKGKLKNILLVAGSVVLLSMTIELLNSSGNINADNNTFSQTYKIFPVPLPDTMSFAGEKVPMNHFGIRENLEQEMLVNTYWQSQTLLVLKRTHRYFPVIEQILKKNGIPEDFKYLAMAESGFSYKVSGVGASGFWQFMKSTGEAYGLEITKDVDERYNLEKSTEAACRYFKEAYAEFHNWTLVAASYNLGLGGVAKELQRQRQNNYYDLELNTETARYVYRILALKALSMSPKQFGYYLKTSDMYNQLPVYVMPVDSSINDLADFAISKGINYRVLKMLNPWLLTDKLPDLDKRIYAISLPVKNVPFLDLGEYVTFADSTSLIAKAADTLIKQDGSKGKITIHIVKTGENIQSIAKQYNVSVEKLCAWNSITDTLKLKPKDELMIFEK